jgi:hypothetical protein
MDIEIPQTNNKHKQNRNRRCWPPTIPHKHNTNTTLREYNPQGKGDHTSSQTVSDKIYTEKA